MKQSLSLSGSVSTIGKHQNSILRQFKRVSFGEDMNHFDIDSIQFTSIPSQLPLEVRNNFTRCINLTYVSFFEMFSFVIFEYLFKGNQQKGKGKIKKLKRDICAENFLKGSGYIKGLLIKGLKILEESKQKEGPIAQELMRSECFQAFSQCWKEIVRKAVYSALPENEVELFRHLGEYFEVTFQIYFKISEEYSFESIKPSQAKSSDSITVVMQTRSTNDSGDILLNDLSKITAFSDWIYYLLFKSKATSSLMRTFSMTNDDNEAYVTFGQEIQPQKVIVVPEFVELISKSKTLLLSMKKFLKELQRQ